MALPGASKADRWGEWDQPASGWSVSCRCRHSLGRDSLGWVLTMFHQWRRRPRGSDEHSVWHAVVLPFSMSICGRDVDGSTRLKDGRPAVAHAAGGDGCGRCREAGQDEDEGDDTSQPPSVRSSQQLSKSGPCCHRWATTKAGAAGRCMSSRTWATVWAKLASYCGGRALSRGNFTLKGSTGRPLTRIS